MKEVFDSLIKMIPQFYITEESLIHPESSNKIKICEIEYAFNSIVRISDTIKIFLDEVERIEEIDIPLIESRKIRLELLEQLLVKKWLKVKGYNFN